MLSAHYASLLTNLSSLPPCNTHKSFLPFWVDTSVHARCIWHKTQFSCLLNCTTKISCRKHGIKFFLAKCNNPTCILETSSPQRNLWSPRSCPLFWSHPVMLEATALWCFMIVRRKYNFFRHNKKLQEMEPEKQDKGKNHIIVQILHASVKIVKSKLGTMVHDHS